jgi:protein associated with RNAse G/E
VVLVDEDEFAAHQVRYSYPAEVIRQAEQAAAWLQHAISDRAEPFAVASLAWLEKVC